MLLNEEIKNYTKPTTKKEARKNIQSFWFNLFDTQQGTIFENLTERTQIVMKLLYQELSAFDKRIRQDIKITFNTDRSRYWKEYITAFPDKKKSKKPALKIRKQKQELKNINEQIEDRTFIQQQQNKQLQAQTQLIKQQGDKIKEIKKEQISYIAQQGFLQEFANTDFYKRNTSAILNQQAIINNYIKKAFDANLENYDKKFIIALMEKHNQLLMAFGIDKLMQLQPQAIIAFCNQINETKNTNNTFNLMLETLNKNKKQ